MKRLVHLCIAIVLLGSITVQYTPAQIVSTPCDFGCTIEWTPPTEYTDNTVLLEQDLDFYSWYCDGNHVVDFDAIIGTWAADISFGAPGSYTCGLTTTAINGQESELSNTKVFTKGPRIPRPPILLGTT